MRTGIALLLAMVMLTGCSGGAADEGKELTSAEIQKLKAAQASAPDLPPQAKAAMEASGRYGNQYSADQQKSSGK
jgi:hypothetical protein